MRFLVFELWTFHFYGPFSCYAHGGEAIKQFYIHAIFLIYVSAVWNLLSLTSFRERLIFWQISNVGNFLDVIFFMRDIFMYGNFLGCFFMVAAYLMVTFRLWDFLVLDFGCYRFFTMKLCSVLDIIWFHLFSCRYILN